MAGVKSHGRVPNALVRTLVRLLRYNMVGVLNLAVKFSVLTGLVELAGMGYLPATVIALEAAILNSFTWHLRWTWRDRSAGLSPRGILWRLAKFHLGNGAVALVVNLLVMRWLVGSLGLHYAPASVAATICAGAVNFTIANFVVFVPSGHPAACRT